MKCHVPGSNVKVLARTIHVLARFGNELYLECLQNDMVLKTMNSTESAYALVKFNKNFFSYYNYNYYSANDDDTGFKCKISMKSALHTFKSPIHLDKQVESLEVKLDPDSCKIIFQLKCRHGIVKTHFVSILDSNVLQDLNTKDSVPNRITSSQRLLMEAINSFQNSDGEITLQASDQSLLLRNYVDASSDLRVIRTQINLKCLEFESYVIGAETMITINLKELRAVLAFAEALNLPIQINFEESGQPAVFIVHNGTTFEAQFTFATSNTASSTQTTSIHNGTFTDRNKRKDISINMGSVRKKQHTNKENCFEEDAELFNLICIPDNNKVQHNNVREKNETLNDGISNMEEDLNCDSIPGTPVSNTIQSVFKRCLEQTIDHRSLQPVARAENSDSE